MNFPYAKSEVEKPKPTDRMVAQRIEVIDDLIDRLIRQPHVAPCLRGSYVPRGSCSCWLHLAVDFLEGAKSQYPAVHTFVYCRVCRRVVRIEHARQHEDQTYCCEDCDK